MEKGYDKRKTADKMVWKRFMIRENQLIKWIKWKSRLNLETEPVRDKVAFNNLSFVNN